MLFAELFCKAVIPQFGSVSYIKEENLMAAQTPKKCGNAACSCVPPANAKYCSAHCEGVATKVEILCTCGHPGCEMGSART